MKTKQPTDKNLNRTIGLRLTGSMWDRLERLAAVEGRPTSWAARDALALGMEMLEKNPEQAKAMRVAMLGKGE